MSNAAAPAANAAVAPVQFEIQNYTIVAKGNILGRFDMYVKGLGTLFKCGLFRKNDGSGLFVNLPSVNISRWDPKAQFPHIKMGSIERELNDVYTAAAEAAHAAEVQRIQAQAAGVGQPA